MKILRRDWTGFLSHSLLGRLIRLPFRMIPDFVTLPILTGPLNGMKWVASSSLTSCWLGTYELSLQKTAEKYIRPGMTVYDVGAHVGFFTMFFARLVGNTGIVHAIEPYPDNCSYIRRHVDLNEIDNVRLWQLALSDTVGYTGFRPSHHSSMGTITDDDTGLLMVPVTTMDRLIGDGHIDPPDIVKVDIEGHERQFLQGAEETIERCSPVMFIEVHSLGNDDFCRRFLKGLGYSVVDVEGGCDSHERHPRMICALPSGREDGCG